MAVLSTRTRSLDSPPWTPSQRSNYNALASKRSFGCRPGGDSLPPEFLKRQALTLYLLQLASPLAYAAAIGSGFIPILPLQEKRVLDYSNKDIIASHVSAPVPVN